MRRLEIDFSFLLTMKKSKFPSCEVNMRIKKLNVLKRLFEKNKGLLLPRERRVLALRFGFDDGKTRSLEEAGETFGVTRERIRQLEMKAIEKIGLFNNKLWSGFKK